ncbi:MAG: GNAT family N-acetyltransferase [Chloroflexota bacterium]|nr:GNAT family N-acetyltransferase [Chloroflexota bacterium]
MSEAAPAGGRTVRSWPITVRRARPDDKAAVLSFATRTWDDWDYIPQVWDRWLAASDGVMLVATVRGADADANGSSLPADLPVAFTRLARLSPDEMWLEGIRVDPRVRGLGVATDLQVAELHWAAAHGTRVIRYVTGQDNEGSRKLGAKHGFAVVGWLRSYGHDESLAAAVPSDPVEATGVRALGGSADLGAWWRALERDPTFRQGCGLYESRSWAFRELTEDRFWRHAAEGRVIVGEDAESAPQPGPSERWALAILRPGPEGEDDADAPVPPALVAGDGHLMLRILASLGNGRPGVPSARLPDPSMLSEPRLAAAWADAGWQPHDRATIVLECRLAGRPLPEVDAAALELQDKPQEVAQSPD